LEDLLQKDQIEEAWILSRTVCMLRHPVFPILYDISFDGQKMMTFQEYYEGQFLDDYLKDHQPDQDTIIRWTDNIVQGIAYLYERHFSFRDFARGSMIVDRNNDLRFFRLHHPYYGLISTNEENRQYFFEQSLQEIAILLAQLCLKTDPKLPIRIIESDSFEKNFLDKVNVIIQKCAREKGRSRYSSFEELL
jgi:hypothetical protein